MSSECRLDFQGMTFGTDVGRGLFFPSESMSCHLLKLVFGAESTPIQPWAIVASLND